MSNPAFTFDHIHIISQNPHDAANWYVQMFGAEIVADKVAYGAPQIFLELGGRPWSFAATGPAKPPHRPVRSDRGAFPFFRSTAETRGGTELKA
jgi:catechol 2,3-dioxygenase-like lactoylglutathione lyase family enzyme